MRRIVLYAPGWPPGVHPNGIVSYVANLCASLAELGIEPLVLAAEVSVSDAHVANVRVLRDKRGLSTKVLDGVLARLAPDRCSIYLLGHDLMASLAHIARTRPFDLLEMEESFGLVDRVRRAIDAPTVVRIHGPWFLNGPALGVGRNRAFQRRVRDEGRALEHSFATSCPSQDVIEQCRRHYGIALAGAEVIPNPGPMVTSDQCWRADLCDPHTVLFVGRFDRLKGGDIVLDAFRIVGRREPTAKLLFVGPDVGYIDDTGNKMGLAAYLDAHLPDGDLRRRVHVLGRQSQQEISELRRRAAVTVVASRQESFPMTVVEAIAFGTPLVAARAGGIQEIVRDGRTALTFAAGDAQDLAAKLQVLLVNRQMAATLAQTARADYQARFAPGVVAGQTAEFYQRVIDRWQRRGTAGRTPPRSSRALPG
jgi:glycosyltransferase involved in cell wall biosynthesis